MFYQLDLLTVSGKDRLDSRPPLGEKASFEGGLISRAVLLAAVLLATKALGSDKALRLLNARLQQVRVAGTPVITKCLST